jgi:hypothetical protein
LRTIKLAAIRANSPEILASWDSRARVPGEPSQSDPSPRLEALPGRKSWRFFARRGVRKALDDEACHPLRTCILNE